MKFAFHVRVPIARQLALAQAVVAGAKSCGDEVEIVTGFREVLDVDGGIVFGIGGIGDDHPRLPFDAYIKAKKHMVFFDKGYTRNNSYRVAVNCFQPLEFVRDAKCTIDRYRALQLRAKGFNTMGRYVLLDGASWKYCEWQGLGDWATWGQSMIDQIRRFTDMEVIYRPRPVREGIPKVTNAIPSNIELAHDLQRARVVVSYGGNIGFDAILNGTPHFAVGDSIAKCMSERTWTNINNPYIPAHIDRTQWFANIAWCQWFVEELQDGSAWRFIRSQIDGSWRKR